MIKNQQRPEARADGDGSILEVNSIFDTIQGEGPFAGQRATFVRLAGCNLQCPLCDTEYSERQLMRVDAIIGEVQTYPARLIVITGGEPFRQPLELLIQALHNELFQVQIETNGKLPPADPSWWGWTRVPTFNRQPTIIVSPKTARLDPFFQKRADAFKYVVKAGAVAEDRLPIRALDHPVPTGSTIARPPEDWRGPIFVQPADEQDDTLNSWNMAAAVAAVMHHDRRRRLCLQMHKYARLP